MLAAFYFYGRVLIDFNKPESILGEVYIYTLIIQTTTQSW